MLKTTLETSEENKTTLETSEECKTTLETSVVLGPDPNILFAAAAAGLPPPPMPPSAAGVPNDDIHKICYKETTLETSEDENYTGNE